MFLEARCSRIFALCQLLSSRCFLLRYTWFTKLLAAYLSLKLRCLGLLLLVECYSSLFRPVFFTTFLILIRNLLPMLIGHLLLALISLLLIAPSQCFAARNSSLLAALFLLFATRFLFLICRSLLRAFRMFCSLFPGCYSWIVF